MIYRTHGIGTVDDELVTGGKYGEKRIARGAPARSVSFILRRPFSSPPQPIERRKIKTNRNRSGNNSFRLE